MLAEAKDREAPVAAVGRVLGACLCLDQSCSSGSGLSSRESRAAFRALKGQVWTVYQGTSESSWQKEMKIYVYFGARNV